MIVRHGPYTGLKLGIVRVKILNFGCRKIMAHRERQRLAPNTKDWCRQCLRKLNAGTGIPKYRSRAWEVKEVQAPEALLHRFKATDGGQGVLKKHQVTYSNPNVNPFRTLPKESVASIEAALCGQDSSRFLWFMPFTSNLRGWLKPF
ncbi:hypothetical protein LZ32DRAFT_622276 [Colletotrichum eremochloae]|nr:hypothetical protein LZ32DRAFT_622276 [Colletotrichum eremochloae]